MRFSAPLAGLALTLSLSACGNPYYNFYQNAATPSAVTHTLPATGEPRIGRMGPDMRANILTMYQQGYELIGTAAFSGPTATIALATAQARRVGAEVVLIRDNYQNTRTDYAAVQTPTATTTYNAGTVATPSPYDRGPHGTLPFPDPTGLHYENAATTYSTQTAFVPVQTDVYQHGALFFAQLDRTGFGLYLDHPTDAQIRQAGTNKLVTVAAVRTGSPAFLADVLPGDLVLSVAGRPTYDPDSLSAAVASTNGQPADLVLLRDGKRVTRPFTAPATW